MAYINGNEILFSPIIGIEVEGGDDDSSGGTAIISNGKMLTIEAAAVTVESDNSIIIGG